MQHKSRRDGLSKKSKNRILYYLQFITVATVLHFTCFSANVVMGFSASVDGWVVGWIGGQMSAEGILFKQIGNQHVNKYVRARTAFSFLMDRDRNKYRYMHSYWQKYEIKVNGVSFRNWTIAFLLDWWENSYLKMGIRKPGKHNALHCENKQNTHTQSKATLNKFMMKTLLNAFIFSRFMFQLSPSKMLFLRFVSKSVAVCTCPANKIYVGM